MRHFDDFDAACDFARTEVARHGRLSAGCTVDAASGFACFMTARLATGRSMEGSAFRMSVHAAADGGFSVS